MQGLEEQDDPRADFYRAILDSEFTVDLDTNSEGLSRPLAEDYLRMLNSSNAREQRQQDWAKY